MKIGIIGLPRSGKTTLWKLLTESYDESEHAHLGQKPRVKVVKLKDARLEKLRDDYTPKKYSPAQIEILDFPGVQKDAADRSGIADLLHPAREAEALILVIAMFREEGGKAPEPARDFREILGELIISDLVIVEKRLEKLEAQIKKHVSKTIEDDKRDREILLRVKAHLEAERDLASFPLTPEEKKRVSNYQFLSAKPRLAVLNLGGEPRSREEAASVEELIKIAGTKPICVAVENELEILQLPPEERAPFLAEFGIQELARDRLIAASYRASGRLSFFTVGEKEVHAWTIREGETAWEAAGEVHTDMQRGFIRAEVVSFEDYEKYGGMKGAREKGHFRLEGKEYVVKDGDIIEFRFSV